MIPAVQGAESQVAKFRVGVGFAAHADTAWSSVRALAMARSGLEGATPQLALVVTAGIPSADPVATVRAVLGPVAVAGGGTSMLLTNQGPIREGALVVCIANSEGAVSGAAATSGGSLSEASQGAARLILAGWPFRLRYPRGLGVAFARPGFGPPAREFLDAWRPFMGPKMRTVCGVMPLPVLYGSAKTDPVASVACLEASYSTGLGYANGFAEDGSAPDVGTLIHGAADAALTALKRLEGHCPRLVLVVESLARYKALGATAAEEWAAIRAEVSDGAPCVGWLCDRVAAYGRGVRPVDAPGSMVVVAVGDPPRG